MCYGQFWCRICLKNCQVHTILNDYALILVVLLNKTPTPSAYENDIISPGFDSIICVL